MTSATREKKRRGGWFKEEFGTLNGAWRTTWSCRRLSSSSSWRSSRYSTAVVLSLTDSTITGFGSFVGAENYTEMFANPDFREGLKNTVIFTVASVALEFIIGLGVALAINRAFRGRGLVRAAVLVPWAFPTVISAVMWRLMFQPGSGSSSTANAIGLISEPILSDPTLLLIAASWLTCGRRCRSWRSYSSRASR